MSRVLEGDLAHELGIPRSALTRQRKKHLRRGHDWRVVNRQVVIESHGVEELMRLFGVEAPAEKTSAAIEGARERQLSREDAVILEVTQARPGKRIIVCRDPMGRTVRCRVRKSDNFLPGMKLNAVQDVSMPDVYSQVGRCPRSRGRW
jgi:hypothetical protein